jgi:CCR4-NOT transcription complex subunit 7/8
MGRKVYDAPPAGEDHEIRDVWASNLEEEMSNIIAVSHDYPFVAMDTEFPGTVADGSPLHFDPYLMFKANVDELKLIQLGLTFTDAQGNLPDGCATWQFNFKWSLTADKHASSSISLLKQSGIDFGRFQSEGIDIARFGSLFLTSGIPYNPSIHWIAFHSIYDFGYLVKSLVNAPLPAKEEGWLTLLRDLFPSIYDVKYMAGVLSSWAWQGGLQRLAGEEGVVRYGPQHQAGSDSLLTAGVFFRVTQRRAPTPEALRRFVGQVYGLHESGPAR